MQRSSQIILSAESLEFECQQNEIKCVETVIIALSASKHSIFAFNWALQNYFNNSDIAQKKVVLLTVQTSPTPLSYFGDPFFDDELLERKYFKLSRELLDHYRQKFLETYPNANIELIVARSDPDPGNAIVSFASEEKADLVILGSRGLGAMKRVFLGSVGKRDIKVLGDYCAHNLKCPLIIVKHP